MDLIQMYTIATGSIFGVLVLVNGWPWIARLVRYISPLVLKHMVYRHILHRHRLLGPWSRASVLLQLTYIAGNITCVSLGGSHVQTQVSTLSQAGLRAGTPLYHQHDPTVCGSSPRLSRRSAWCESPHDSADPSVGRHDGGSARGFPYHSSGWVASIFCCRPGPEP